MTDPSRSRRAMGSAKGSAMGRNRSPWPGRIGIFAVVATWVLFRISARQQPGYDPIRDTLSSLASQGAEQGWIGMLAIMGSGVASMIAMVPMRRLSHPAALALGVAGMALIWVAFTRIACPDGAAGCIMGPATDYWTATAHTIGIILFEVMLVGAVGSAALCLWRGGQRAVPIAAGIGMVLSVIFFAVAPLEVGIKQRLWLLVNTMLIGGTFVLPLEAGGVRARARQQHGAEIRQLASP